MCSVLLFCSNHSLRLLLLDTVNESAWLLWTADYKESIRSRCCSCPSPPSQCFLSLESSLHSCLSRQSQCFPSLDSSLQYLCSLMLSPNVTSCTRPALALSLMLDEPSYFTTVLYATHIPIYSTTRVFAHASFGSSVVQIHWSSSSNTSAAYDCWVFKSYLC